MSQKIKDLLKRIPEVYQDVELNGTVIAKGRRNCAKRWKLIKDHIGPHDVVLDVGSSLGYFSHKIATEYPDSLVISFESEPEMCQIQAEIFRQEGIYNVVVCNARLIPEELDRWVKHVDCFDTVLALSVLHHYEPGTVKDVFNNLRKLAPKIIGEGPAKREIEACGGEAKEETLKIEKSADRVLGKVKSHLGLYMRSVWMSLTGTEPWETIDRDGLDAYFGVSHDDRNKFNLQYHGHWELNGKRMVPGVNAHNLKYFDVVWPEPAWWSAQAIGAYKGLDFKSDVRWWNLLMTSTGLKAIDFMTKFPAGDPAEFRKNDYRKLVIK